MKISERLTEDMKQAMKSGEKDRLGVIRMLRAELKNAQIAAGDTLSDEQEEKVLKSYAKKRKDSGEQYVDLGRQDLADKEQREYDLTMAYLPEQLDEDALTALVKEAIAETGAEGIRDLGRVIKAVMASAGSKVDGSMVSAVAKKLLTG